MSTGNPLEQLRRRLQSPATPTAFAALAEDYRRAGRFADAITTCREGLARYPAYASARVTLGRALLDSGDLAAAITELELAVAQSPDNLAAGRALQSALAARGDDADMPAAAPPQQFADLPRGAAAEEFTPTPTDVVAEALGARPDGPQEFGLDADWSIPDVSQPAALAGPTSLDWLEVSGEPAGAAHDGAIATSATPLAGVEANGEATHAEAPTLCFTPPHLQGEEPAGIWETPVAETSHDASACNDGARVVSWAIDPPGVPVAAVSEEWNASEQNDPASVWDAPTIAAPLEEVAPDALPSNAYWSESAAPHGVPLDGEEASSLWSEPFAGESAVEPPEPFAGWGSDAPPMAAGADRSPWSDDAATEGADSGTVPDGPSASWALGSLAEAAGADATPFADRPDPPQEPVDPAMAISGPAWAGSVKSALGEVFALAGGASYEPPVAASPLVENTMADAAVEAAIEDAVTHNDGTSPVVASLEQMLAAVRARRAALSARASS